MKNQNSPFLRWCASRYPNAEAVLAEFFDDAVLAAASVGALLETLPELDGRRHYLPALNGRRDQKQFYVGSLETDGDGTTWPCVTFKSFRGEPPKFWKPRDACWRLFEADRGVAVPDDSARLEQYRAAADSAIATARAKAAQVERLKAEGHRSASAVAEAVWADSGPCEAHPYLVRKTVTSHGLRVASRDHRARLWSDQAGQWQSVLAVRAGDLLVPMLDEAGRLANLQRIGADGTKRFLLGGRAHGCHFRIEGTSGRTVLAEGYATSATWHAATGDTVVLAFSAGALPVVAGYVAADLMAADHDASQAGEKAAQAAGLPYCMPPTVGHDWNDHAALYGLEGVRAAIANAGAEAFSRPFDLPNVTLTGNESTRWGKLSAATTPAEAAAMAWALGRALCRHVPAKLDLNAIMDQLREKSPPGMMNPATLAAIRGALERILGWRKRRAMSGVSMTPEALSPHRVETVDHLPELGADDYKGVLLFNSPMGSGKTQRIGRPFAEWALGQDDRFVATCHRQSLVSELARVLNCDHYQDVGGELAWSVRGFATCLPSLVKRAHAQIFNEAGFVFVDEIAQVLRSIASPVTVADGKSAPDVLRALRDLVSRAVCVIGADAGMDDRVLKFLESCRPGEQFRVIQQPHRDQGLAVRFGFGHDALGTAYGEAMARLSQGEKLWIACGEKSRAIEAHRVLSATGARVLLLHGDNKESAEQAAFWRDPEGFSRGYDCVIANSVISSGMSIQHEGAQHFDHGMLLASGATVAPADALQMLRRVRYLRSWTIAVTPNNARDLDSAEAIISGMEQAAALQGLSVAECSDFDKFAAGIEADNARQRADFASGLWWALEHQGFTVERLETRTDADLDAELKILRADLRKERRAAILSAPDLTDADAKRLRDKPGRSEEELYALLRHRAKTELGTETLDAADLDDWDDGRGPRQMDRFSAAVHGLALKTNHAGTDLSLHRFGKARALAYAWLFHGIDLSAGLRLTPEMARIIMGRVIERAHLLAFLGLVPSKWARHLGHEKDGTPRLLEMPTDKTLMREVGAILDLMGLETRRRRNNRKARMGATSHDIPLVVIGASGTHGREILSVEVAYEVLPNSWHRMARLADRRNRWRAVAAVVDRAAASPAPAAWLAHWGFLAGREVAEVDPPVGAAVAAPGAPPGPPVVRCD